MPKTQTKAPRPPRAHESATAPSAPAVAPTQVGQVDIHEPTSLPGTKLGIIVELVSRPDGAKLTELMAATGWQAHSVRGALSGALRKRLKLNVTSKATEVGRVYHVSGEAAS